MRDIILGLILAIILFVLVYLVAYPRPMNINVYVTDNCCCCDNYTQPALPRAGYYGG